MIRFLVGLLLGALSGGATYAVSHDSNLALLIAAVVAIAAWFGHALFIFIDD